MKIKTRTLYFTLIPILFGICVIGIQLEMGRRVSSELELESLVSEFTLQSTVLHQLTGEIARYPGEARPMSQWSSTHANMVALLPQIEPSQREIRANYTQTLNLLQELFDNFCTQCENQAGQPVVLTETQGRTIDRMLLLSQGLISDNMTLRESAHLQVQETRDLEELLIFSIAAVLLFGLGVFAYSMGRQIISSVSTLVAGTEIVGAGDLRYRFGLISRDELGDLGLAFDRMVERLQKTVASRDELNKEVKERKIIELQLSQFQNTLNQTTDCIFIFDPETLKFSYVNQGATQQIGYSEDELLEMTPLDIKPEFDEVSFSQLAESIINSPEKEKSFETVHRHKDGSLIPVEISLQYLVPAKTPPRFVAIVRDITTRRETEEKLKNYSQHLEDMVSGRTLELEHARDQAESANRAKSTFLANMSHELRTPLSAIIGFASQVLGLDETTDSQKQPLELIQESGEKLLTVFNNVIEISRLESSDSYGQLEEKTVDFIALLDRVIDEKRNLAAVKGLQFVTDIAENIPCYIEADPDKLYRIIAILLDNAIKFTEAGQVALSVLLGDSDSKDAANLIIEVSDTGVGIAPENQGRIFEPFVQLGGDALNLGAGLGLSILRRYLHLLGGEVEVESELGKGSKFRVSMTVTIATDTDIESIGRGPSEEPSPLKPVLGELTPEVLHTLPKEMQSRIQRAVLELDIEGMLDIIAEMREIDSELARALQHKVKALDFISLQKLLE